MTIEGHCEDGEQGWLPGEQSLFRLSCVSKADYMTTPTSYLFPPSLLPVFALQCFLFRSVTALISAFVLRGPED